MANSAEATAVGGVDRSSPGLASVAVPPPGRIRRSGKRPCDVDAARATAAEAASRDNEGRFRATFEAAATGMCHLTCEWSVLCANRRLSDALGLPPDALVGADLQALVHPDDRIAIAALRAGMLSSAGGPRSATEVRLRRADGTYLWVGLAACLVRSAGGTPDYVVLTAEVVGAHREREAQLRHLQKLELLGRLTGGVAHDFNNVLAVMIGNLELLSRSIDGDGQQRELLDDAIDAASRGAALVSRLLAFGRPRQALQPELTRVETLVAQVGRLLARTVGSKVVLSVQFDDGLPLVNVDRGQLEAAIVNLAVNARDAMPKGGRLSISVGAVSGPLALPPVGIAFARSDRDGHAGDYVVVTVADAGIGIPADVLPHVFEPFCTTRKAHGGTGLGLSMVSDFVKAAGGQVSISSEVGTGTTVRLLLPAAAASATAATERPDRVATLPGRLSVLVVECDAALRRTTERLLESLDCVPVTAENAEAAQRLLGGEGDFDVLLTDVAPGPGKNGFELAAEARRRRPQLAVVYLSGGGEPLGTDRRGRLRAGVFLAKPFRRYVLAERLSAALREVGVSN